MLVKYTEEEIAFKADLISTKALTSELVKRFKLKKPAYLTMTTTELVTSLKEVVNNAYGVNQDDRLDAAKEHYECRIKIWVVRFNHL